MARRLRLVFFGTPGFAVPSLEALHRGGHSVVLVLSQPDRGRGRGRSSSPSPVSGFALREGISLLRPDRVGEASVVDAFFTKAAGKDGRAILVHVTTGRRNADPVVAHYNAAGRRSGTGAADCFVLRRSLAN